MAEENENLNSTNEELAEQVKLETEGLEEVDDPDVLKEKLAKVQSLNAQLYARTKKAEGFIKGEDGKWVKKPIEPAKPEIKPATQPLPEESEILKKVDERLEQRELESLELSDSLKREVQNYAKLNGVSVKKALASDYIQFMVEKEKAAEKTEAASLGGGKRGISKKDYSQVDPSAFDLRTEEGREDKKKWEETIKKQLG